AAPGRGRTVRGETVGSGVLRQLLAVPGWGRALRLRPGSRRRGLVPIPRRLRPVPGRGWTLRRPALGRTGVGAGLLWAVGARRGRGRHGWGTPENTWWGQERTAVSADTGRDREFLTPEPGPVPPHVRWPESAEGLRQKPHEPTRGRQGPDRAAGASEEPGGSYRRTFPALRTAVTMDAVARGELRIYLGYAPGVGTTYSALTEAHRRAAHGAEVLVGAAVTHGRRHTGALLEGLSTMP